MFTSLKTLGSVNESETRTIHACREADVLNAYGQIELAARSNFLRITSMPGGIAPESSGGIAPES